jgi:hypothetical protein
MKRLYYLTDDIESCAGISRDLHEAGITDWNFHVLGKDEAGLYKRQIHSAGYLHKLDIVRDAERGGMIGLLAAIVLAWYLSASDAFSGHTSTLMYIAIFGFITMFGIWAGGMVGLSTENQKIARYHDAIESGRFLVMLDVNVGEEEKLKDLMASRHPEAEFQRIGSTFINPFKFAQSAPVH